MPVRLWITRTQPGADRQAAELEAAGYETLVAPVLKVETTAAAPPSGHIDMVVFLSEHAVRFSENFSFCAGAQLFAVGLQTGSRLEAAGYSAQVPEDQRSEGLLKMPEFASLRGKRVLLVAGEGGRDLLADTLAQRGATVTDYRCYRRVAVTDVELSADQVDVIIAASGDGLAAIAMVDWRTDFGGVAGPAIPNRQVGGDLD